VKKCRDEGFEVPSEEFLVFQTSNEKGVTMTSAQTEGTEMVDFQNTLIEYDYQRSAYGRKQSRAIVQHHEHGRLLLVEGFGGTRTIEGGAYRWKASTTKIQTGFQILTLIPL